MLRVYPSGKLAMHWKGGKIKKVCEYCGKEFSVFPCRKNARFCSCKCNASSRTGEKSSNWQGGVDLENKRIRKSLEYEIWRNSVYGRDNFTCQICGKKCRKKDIISHHIKSFSEYPKLRFDIDNGITLCRGCHKKVHKEIGYETRFLKVNY